MLRTEKVFMGQGGCSEPSEEQEHIPGIKRDEHNGCRSPASDGFAINVHFQWLTAKDELPPP